MSLDYAAAEFLIGVLSKSANFSINLDKLNNEIKQANKDVISYLKEESENNFLFLFKKFPDVFVLNIHAVSFTDAFLSLHTLSELSHFSTQYETPFEKSIVEYFKLILNRYATFSTVQLFNMIMLANIENAANRFAHYTTLDMQTFFKKHSNTFTVVYNNVYLNTNLYIDAKMASLDDKMCGKSLNKLTGYVYFLLTCFKSLHYMELKQCISYISSSVKEFLNRYSLIKQRQIFENFLETKMDMLGFLSLVNYKEHLLKSCKKNKINLLIVCILAFEREMHFQKIVQEVNKRTSQVSSMLCSLTISEQFNYFRSLPQYFLIQNNGYVSLSNAFIFPLCSFENSCLSLVESQAQIKPSISCFEEKKLQNSTILPAFHSKESKHPDFEVDKHDFISNSSDISANSKICANNSLSFFPINYTVLNQRIKFSVLFLLQHLDFALCEIMLKCILHILDDVRISFLNLPSELQNIFIKEYCYFYNTEIIKNKVSKASSKVLLGRKEEILLFITYKLIEKGKIHYEKLSKLISNVIDNSFSSLAVFEQYQCYKMMAGYLIIHENGCISLDSSFESVNSIISAYFREISEISPPHKNAIEVNGQVDDDSNSNKVSGFFKKPLDFSKISLNIETDQQVIVYRRLQDALFYLQNYFNPLSCLYVLKTFFHSLSDVYPMFYKLPTADQIKFIEKCFRFINNKLSMNEISNFDFQHTTLSEDEKEILLITYLLIKEKKSLHFQKIIMKLKKLKINFSVSNQTVSSQFKHFKNWDRFFIINNEGYVWLNSLNCIISAAIDALPGIETKSNIETKVNAKSKLIKNPLLKSIETLTVPTNSNADAIDSILDICVSILSACDKMHIEKLCNRVDSCDAKNVQHYFSSYTIAEKIRFFKNASLKFDVSKDGFVSLKQNTFVANVHKACIETTNNPKTVVLSKSESSSESKSSRNVIKQKSRKKSKNKTNSKVLSMKSTLSLKGTNSENFITLHKESVSKENQNNSYDSGCIGNSEDKAYKNVYLENCKLNACQEYLENSGRSNSSEIKNETSLNEAFVDTNKVIKNVNFINSAVKSNDFTYTLEINNDLNKNLIHSSASSSPDFDSSEIYGVLSSTANSDNFESGDLEPNSPESYDEKVLNSCSRENATSSYNKEISLKHFNSSHLAVNEPLVKNCDDLISNSFNKTCLISGSNHTLKCDSEQKDSNLYSSKTVLKLLEDDVIELRAVNFFCVILGKFDTDVSSDFLLNHINFASLEVQSFMIRNFENDVISFFLKHNKFFYVSPQTHNISLVKSN